MSEHKISRGSYFQTLKSAIRNPQSAIRRGLALFSLILLMLAVPAKPEWANGRMGERERGVSFLPLSHSPTLPLSSFGSWSAEDAVIRQVSIDEAGVITYIKGDAIYSSGRGGGPRRQIKVGDAAPRAGGKFAQFLDVSSATVDTGILGLGKELRIVFKATIEGGNVSQGIFLFTENRGVDTIALPGDIAPDTGKGSFSGFPGRVVISRLGTIMFRATVTGGKASEGLFFAPRGFLTREASIGSVAVQGEAAPETGGGSFASFGEYDLTEATLPVPVIPFVLKVDLFAYIANVQGGRVPQGLFSSTFVVVGASPLQLELRPSALALVGKDAAGLRGKSTYAGFEDVLLTNKIEVVFRAKLAGGTTPEGIFQIVFVGPVQLATPRVLLGDQAPIPRANVKFAQFGRMVGNNSEQLFFEADLQGDGPPQALFLVTLGPLTLMSETLSVGDQAPGTNGGTYGRLGPLSVNDGGFVAFQAGINGGNMSEAVFSELAKRAKFVDGVPR